MYAFRKPFNAGLYENLFLWGIDYKVILIIAQVFGYMLSKFIGIKVIGELKSSIRIRLITGLILFAEVALLGLALVPYPYNFLFMFLNGLPLGMVWGIVFSFLEGRRFTEVLVFGLSISVIVASGALKTIYLQIHAWFPFIPEFWMPFVMGACFLPLFILFVWMLSVIPDPTKEDQKMRTKRIPMDNQRKIKALKLFGPGLFGIVTVYALLTAMRDFRDNFSVEIWNEIAQTWQIEVLTTTEFITGIIVMLIIALLVLIKNNVYGFWASAGLIVAGLIGCGISTYLFQAKVLSPFSWMVLLGTSMFMAYIPIQTIFFDRMLAASRFSGNAGFFIYICDAIGYLSSVTLLLYKEFFIMTMNWSQVLAAFSYFVSGIGLILLIVSMFFFRKILHHKTVKKESVDTITQSQII